MRGTAKARERRRRVLLTEKEALEKWCPLPGVIAATDYMTDTDTCVASKCMGWRWADPPTKREITMTREEIADMCNTPLDKVEAADCRDVPNPHRRGFCGLAGKPDLT
jgi:hypothetical protein